LEIRQAQQLACANKIAKGFNTRLWLLRQARRDAGGRELRRLAWRRGVTPIG
jgi:hypothetical protein